MCPLLLLNTRAQPERTRDDHVAAVKLGEELDALPRDLQAQPEAVIDIPLERLDVVLGVVPRVLDELVDSAFGEGELGVEPGLVLDRLGLGERREEVDPREGRVAEGEEDEDFGTREALVLRVARRGGGFGVRGELREVVVVFQDSRAGPMKMLKLAWRYVGDGGERT